MSLRVAVLAATSLPWHGPGGLERHVFQLCRWLRKRDVCVDLFTSSPQHRSEPIPPDDGFRVSIVPGTPFLRGRYVVVLSRNTLYPLFSLRMGKQVLSEATVARLRGRHRAGARGLRLRASTRPAGPGLLR